MPIITPHRGNPGEGGKLNCHSQEWMVLTCVAASMGSVPWASSKNASSQLTAITTGAYRKNTRYILSLASV